MSRNDSILILNSWLFKDVFLLYYGHNQLKILDCLNGLNITCRIII